MTFPSVKEVHFENKYNSITSAYSIDIIWDSVSNIFNGKFNEMVIQKIISKYYVYFFARALDLIYY